MRKYIIRRLMLMPITLIGITFLVFCLTRLVPGGPVERMLQEQSMAALTGEKSITMPSDTVGQDDIERLEEMFNLQEPAWKAYLQWLGVLRRSVEISKAEFGADGIAVLTLTDKDGKAFTLAVQRDGDMPVFLEPERMRAMHWRVTLESPHARALRAAERRGQVTPEELAALEQSPACRNWRAVAHRRAFRGLLEGDLGLSYKYNEPVTQMMAERLPVSLYFGLLGALITYMVSIPLGVFKALHHRSWFDSLSSLLLFVAYAVPGFALGAVLLVYLGARLEWFPLYGLTGPGFEDMPFREQLKDLAMHTVLPLFCYVLSGFAMITMMMKNNLMEHLSADYVRTAVSKGVSFRRAVWCHAFRNSFIPLASSMGGIFAAIIGGSILIERVFDIQGFGMLSFQALIDKDYSLMMGTLLLTSVLIILGNLLSDLFVALIDPRVKFD